MVQSASTYSSQHQEIFAFHKVSKPDNQSKGGNGLMQLLSESDIFELKGQGAFDFPNFPETNKKFRVVYLELSGDFKGLKPILNGFLALGQPQGIIIDFTKDQNQYSFKYYLEDEEKAIDFTNRISAFLKEEVRFKKVLKKVIANQRAFESAQHFLTKKLMS